MKTIQSTELYAGWGDPFDKDDVKQFQEDLRNMFGEGVSVIVEESEDSFTIKVLKENEN